MFVLARYPPPLRVVSAAGIGILLFGAFLTLHTSASKSSHTSEKNEKNLESSLSQDTQNNVDWVEGQRLSADQLAESNLRAVACYLRAAESAKANKQFSFAARVLRRAAEVKLVAGDTKVVLELLFESVSLAKSAGDLTEEGFGQAALAYVHFLAGDSKAAETTSLRALRIAQSANSDHLKALALSSLGEAHYSVGDLQRAQKVQQQAFDACLRIGDQKCVTRSAIALGYYLVNLSEPQEALGFFEQGLEAAKRSNNLQGQAQSLNAIGNIKIKVGDYQGALDTLNLARPLAERVGDRICLGSVLGGLSGVYAAMGEASQSLRLISEALNIFQTIGEKWGIAEAKLDLGRAHKGLGNNDQAIVVFSEALRMFHDLGMNRLEMQALGELASVQRAKGDLTAALATYEQALRLSKVGQDQRHAAFLLNNIGEIYFGRGELGRALLLHERALSLSQVASDPLLKLNSLVNIARIHRDLGRLEEAKREIELATTIAESVRARVSSPNLRTSYLASVHRTYELGIDTLMLLHKRQTNEKLDEQAFVLGEKAKARSFQDQVIDARARSSQSVDPVLIARERLLSEQLNAKAERQMKVAAAKDRTEAARLEKEIEVLTGQYNEVQDQIRATNPIAAALTTSQPLSVRELQEQVVDEDSALLEFSLGDERSYAWVITKSEMFSYELAGRNSIETVANKLYEALTANQAQAGESVEERKARQRAAAEVIPQEAQKLSELLLGQLISKLQNKRLLIVPDGALQYIPFATLVNPQSGERLVANHEIMVEPSGSALALIKKGPPARRVPTKSVLVYADPVFELDDPRLTRLDGGKEVTPHSQQAREVLRDIGISNGQEIPRLFASAREADAIISSIPWGSGRKAVDFSANRESVLSDEVTSYQIVHFATHGASNSAHPELSGIVLSLFDQQGQSRDGVLRLHDIYDLRIPANLVVLSACSTGLGKDVRGEGMIGLARGFMHAGAKSVVASLWKVDDEATAELMGHFYEGMFQKRLTPAAALRFAQLEMAKQPRWQSPYYWAGFVIQGQDLTNDAITRNISLSNAEIAVMSVSLATMILLPGVLLWLRRRRGLS